MIRDISGATFNDAITPSPDASRMNFANRTGSVSKTSGKKGASGLSQGNNTAMSSFKKRGHSVNTNALRSVEEVFGSSSNQAKFCLPLTQTSARDLEIHLQKEKDVLLEKRNKRKH